MLYHRRNSVEVEVLCEAGARGCIIGLCVLRIVCTWQKWCTAWWSARRPTIWLDGHCFQPSIASFYMVPRSRLEAWRHCSAERRSRAKFWRSTFGHKSGSATPGRAMNYYHSQAGQGKLKPKVSPAFLGHICSQLSHIDVSLKPSANVVGSCQLIGHTSTSMISLL